MLVFSRLKGQTVICDQIGLTITICEVKGGKVRIGFEAPKRLNIRRGEIEYQEQEPEQEPEQAQEQKPVPQIAIVTPEPVRVWEQNPKGKGNGKKSKGKQQT